MLYKLAFRNARRSLSDYAVYLITVTLSFSLMFAFGLVTSSDAIAGLSEGMDTFRMILDFINVIILFVLCFLINYTTKFMFTKRSREFGMYLLLGIRRGKVILMFLTEILLLGLFALTLSLPAGFLISQIISMIIVGAFGIPEVIFIAFAPAPAGMLLLYFAVVFLLVLLNMMRKMGRISIRGFLNMEKENEEKVLRSSRKRNVLFCISLLLGVLGFLVWNSQFDLNGASDQSIMYWLLLGIILFILSIYGVSVTAGDMLLTLVLQKRSLKYKGSHLFIARTFSSKVRSMSVTVGTLSMLVVLTLLFLNISYLNQGMFGYLLELEAPYDIQIYDDPEGRDVFNDYTTLIEEDYTVSSSCLFDVYKEPAMNLQPIVSMPGSNTDFDTVIRLSTYNDLLRLRGLSPVSLKDDEYLILTDRQMLPRFEEDGELRKITLADGSSLRLKEITDTGYWQSITGLTSFVAVYPDPYVQDLEPVESHLVIDTEEETTADLNKKLVDEMSWHLTYTDDSGDVANKNYKVTVRGQIVEEGNSMLAIVSSLCLYLAFIFLSTAGTILAVQALSDSSRHKYRYTVLSRLGVSSTGLCRTVGRQLLILFGLPVVYPVIITFLCMSSINRLYGIFLESSWAYLLYFLAGLGIFLLVYLIYFLAAYIGFKRNIQET